MALAGCGEADPAAASEPAPTLEAPIVARGERYVVEVRAEPAPPRTGELFAVRTTVTDREGRSIEGAEVEVDASMPHHRHGMVTRPTHRELGDGHYVSEGMKLHMPGRWQLEIVVRDGERREAFLRSIEQPPS